MQSSMPARRRLVWTSCATLVAAGIWAATSVHPALAAPVSPADKTCQGPGAGGSVHPGQTDTCIVKVSAAGTGFFGTGTTYVLTLTGPAGAAFTSCKANASVSTVTSFNKTTCHVTAKANAATGTTLVTEAISIASATSAGSKVSQTLTFPGFPGFVVPVSGPGASVSAAAAATPSPTAAPAPVPSTGAVTSSVTPGWALAIVVLGAVLVGVGVRRRRTG
jgi:hypothetical protein